jgi:hypothetical protein
MPPTAAVKQKLKHPLKALHAPRLIGQTPPTHDRVVEERLRH